MKNTAALNWIKRNSVSELPKMVSLIICDALYSVCGVSMAVFAKLIIDSAQKGDKDRLIHNAIILLLVIAAQISLKLLSKALEVRISGRLEMKYKSKLFESILKKDYLKISQYHSGELMTRLTSDTAVVIYCGFLQPLCPVHNFFADVENFNNKHALNRLLHKGANGAVGFLHRLVELFH